MLGLAISGMVLPMQPLLSNTAFYGGKETKVKKKVIAFIEQILGENIDLSTFDWNGSYRDTGMDSLDWVECMINVEEFYQIAIPDTEVNALDTPQQLVNIVLKKAKKKNIK